jgi:hypothetical protein
MINLNTVRKLALALPNVAEGTIHGTPSFKVRGKLLCCAALHSSAEPNTLAVRIDKAERARLMAAKPRVYYLTDHYLSYTMVLVRLSKIDRDSLKELLATGRRFLTGSGMPSNPGRFASERPGGTRRSRRQRRRPPGR